MPEATSDEVAAVFFDYELPPSYMPGMMNKALAQVRAAASALTRQIEKEHQAGGEQIARQVASLRAALL